MNKLWQRRKSRVRGGQREREQSEGVSQNPSNVTSTQRKGSVIPPVPESSSKRVASSDAVPPVPPIPRPGSSNRMQPMLIGISRPSGTTSRPGTAESIQNAINRAADGVALSSASELHKQGHTKTKSPRYVDIFAISNPKTSKLSYNEDVASRNIDVKKAAGEDAQYRYVPNSKYQEEVAARNAHGHTMSLTGMSYENLPPRPEVPRYQSADNPPYHIPPEKLADEEDIRRLHEAQLAALRQTRPQAGTKTTSQILRASLDGTRPKSHSRGASMDQSTHPAQILRENAESAITNPPPSMSSELPRKSREYRRSQDIPNRILQPLVTTPPKVPTSALPEYKLSQSEIMQRDVNDRGENRPGERGKVFSSGDQSERTTSMTSSSMRKTINLQNNRTIMDLTHEDEDPPTIAYPESELSKSPVVEDAYVDSFQRAHPEIIYSGGKAEQRNAHETVTQRNEAAKEKTVSGLGRTARQLTPESQSESSFSMINTIASVSPTVRLNGEPLPSSPSHPIGGASTSTSPLQDKKHKLYTVAETIPEAEATGTFARVLANFADQAEAEPTVSEQTTAAKRPPSSSSSVETPKASATAESTPKTIQMSPESLQSRDFVEPSRAFGVLARDFAVTPTKPAQIIRSDREPNTSAKVTQPRAPAVNGDVPRPVENSIPNHPASGSSSSDFDEDKFRQKQEAARAALVKLQQSLDEEFIPPPRTVRYPQKNTSRTRTQSNPSPEGRAGPSANIFSQVREYHTTRPPVNGEIQPRSSSHRHMYSSRERASNGARPESSASVATVRPIQRERSPPNQIPESNGYHSSGLDEMRQIASDMANPRPAPTMKPLAATQKQETSNRNSNSTTSTRSNRSSGALPSPGEVSLSSFPAPSKVQHSRENSLQLPIQNPADQTPPTSTRNPMMPPSRQADPIVEAEEDAAPFPTISRSQPAVTTPPPKTHVSRLQRDASRNPPSSPTSAPAPALQSYPSYQHSPGEQRRTQSRTGSIHSQTSVKTSSSQFSIPYHLIPERGSSMRDSLVREVDDET